MAVEWATKGVVYFPVPKNACTSLKHVFWRLNNAGPMPSFTQEGGIHEMYAGTPSFHLNNLPAYRAWKRVAVVRNPVDRFLSCYVNRVVDMRQLSAEHVLKAAQTFGVPVDPDVHTFIDKLDIYRASSPTIAHHFNPQAYFLGPDLGAYSHVYDISELPDLAGYLGQLGGEDVFLPHIMGSSSKVEQHELSVRELTMIRDLYAGDYALLRSGMTRPKRGKNSRKLPAPEPVNVISLIEDGEINLAQQRQLGSNAIVYVGPGLRRGTVRKGPRGLRILVTFDGESVVALELHNERRIAFGKSYSVEVIVRSKTELVFSLVCRLDDSVSGQKTYLGTSKCHIAPGTTEVRMVLDTEHPPKSVLGEGIDSARTGKFIVLIDKADEMNISITRFKLSPVEM